MPAVASSRDIASPAAIYVQAGTDSQMPPPIKSLPDNSGALNTKPIKLTSEAEVPSSSLQVKDAERKIINNATLNLVVENLNESIRFFSRIAESSGGWVVSSEIGSITGAVLLLRVPADQMDDVLYQLRSNALSVEAESLNSRDVTSEYKDNDARLRSLETTEDALLDLMNRTQKVEEILEVRAELTKVQTELEVLKGQINYLNQATSYSLVSIFMKVEPSNMDVDAGEDYRIGVGKTAKFRAKFHVPNGAENFSFIWDFGDGSPILHGDRTAPTLDENWRVTSTVSHAYYDDSDSPYIARVRLTSNLKNKSFEGEDTLIVSVSRIPVVEVFAGEYISAHAGDEINFEGSFTRPPSLSDMHFEWDFGDGNNQSKRGVEENSTRAPASHIFSDARPFPYRARLTVTGKSETGIVKGTAEVSVYVTEAPGWIIRDWNISKDIKTSVRSLSYAGNVVVNLLIWLVIFSPIWLVVALAIFFSVRFIRIRTGKRRSAVD